tara:strand:+ start:318 stop:572 length:255 start_codon:yes stop_codon:yes gene_type:complete
MRNLYDLPLVAKFWSVTSLALLLFFSGATLGATTAVTQEFSPNEITLTFVVLTSICLLTFASSLCWYWEAVGQRREALNRQEVN